MKNVSKCCLIVQGVEGIRGINLDYPINMWKAEKMLHSVYSNFTATFIICTELETSYTVLVASPSVETALFSGSIPPFS